MDFLETFIRATHAGVETLTLTANTLNLNEKMEWPTRERIRTIEGLLNRIGDELVELVDRIGQDWSEDLMKELWAIDDDE